MELVDERWHEHYLGKERLQIFLDAAKNDRKLAMALVEWDTEMRGELYEVLSRWEIALRNAYDRVMRQWWTGEEHWLLDPRSPVRRINPDGSDSNDRNRRAIDKAVKEATARHGKDAPIAQVISALNLGFWRYLTCKDKEKSLWVPVLHRAFPRPSNRDQIDKQIGRLHRLRNRVAHHEPIFRQRVKDESIALVHSCERLRPELAELIEERGTIGSTWAKCPIELP
jgi:hypothetical protein